MNDFKPEYYALIWATMSLTVVLLATVASLGRLIGKLSRGLKNLDGKVTKLALRPDVYESLTEVYEMEVKNVEIDMLIDFLHATYKHVCDATASVIESKPEAVNAVSQISDQHLRRIYRAASSIIDSSFKNTLVKSLPLTQASMNYSIEVSNIFKDKKSNNHVERVLKRSQTYLSETMKLMVFEFAKIDGTFDIDKVKELIGKNKISAAFKLLPDTKDFIMLRGQYAQADEEVRLNLNDPDALKRYKHKIIKAILDTYEIM